MTAPTPGYNRRLAVFFDHDLNGRKLAYYWSPAAFRAIRLPLADAEVLVAQGQVDLLDGHPLRGSR